jgi:histidinol-phosphate aminotransferase
MSPAHGGADALGNPRWDFSSNANACGPCPTTLAAVTEAEPRHYPDPLYTELRYALAEHHKVEPWRIIVAASASEFIQRITAWKWREGAKKIWIPRHAYGDYSRAASAWGMQQVDSPEQAELAWLCDPISPLGQSESNEVVLALSSQTSCTVVLDCAYEPLRLQGSGVLDSQTISTMWQLWSPNKALGLTGIRAAYAIAPTDGQSHAVELELLAPSWPLGVHGQAMLFSWAQTQTQAWITESRQTLALWTTDLRYLLERLDWHCKPSNAHFFCARPTENLESCELRSYEVKLRDAASFGLPGWWRLSAQKPEALHALEKALIQINQFRISAK